MKIIGLFPLTGNGGIASWAKKIIETFPDEEFQFSFVDVSPTFNLKNSYSRFFVGIYGLFKLLWRVNRTLGKDHYDILHITTSGNIGHIRDYFVAKLCHNKGIKCIIHCHYGCIHSDLSKNGIIAHLIKKTMIQFDQIWVLDNMSYKTLNSIDSLKEKVFITPNSIDVTEKQDNTPKSYTTIAFCGNVYPTKGVMELVEAAIQTNVTLHIIGPASEDIIKRIHVVAGDEVGHRVILHGRLPNKDAVEYLKKIDIIALPTYYKSEAFPISILEAMSLSKMVFSCARAAIPDMLTSIDGSMCGLLVEPKSANSLIEAIEWCQGHKGEADKMCVKAYQKVYSCYRKEAVYEIYRNNYRQLFSTVI